MPAEHRKGSRVGRITSTRLWLALQPWGSVREPILWRMVQLLDNPQEQREVLWIGSGTGRSAFWWAGKHNCHVVGLDPDPEAVAEARETVQQRGVDNISFDEADPLSLPYEPGVFDLTVVNALYLSGSAGLIREAARVTRSLKQVLAVVPTWLRKPSQGERDTVGRVGLEPRMLMEWKSDFREAGLVEISVDDVSDAGRWVQQSLPARLSAGWMQNGWEGLRAALSKPSNEIARLARQRTLGLSLVKGVRWPEG